MISWMIMIGLLWYGMRMFRRSVTPIIRADHDIVAEAERLTGVRSNRYGWARPVLATSVAWAGLMATLTPVNPTLAVWVGGIVVALGAFATALALPDPTKIDDADFDAALRDLLDQSS